MQESVCPIASAGRYMVKAFWVSFIRFSENLFMMFIGKIIFGKDFLLKKLLECS